MFELIHEGWAKGSVGEEWRRVGSGGGDSRYTAEALRWGLEHGKYVKFRPQWLECKKSGLEGLGMRLKRKVGNKSRAMTLMCFKQGVTESDLLFERVILVANQRAGLEEEGWKPEDQVVAAVQSGVTGGLSLGR